MIKPLSYIRGWEAICVFCWKRLPHACSQLCPASQAPAAPGLPPRRRLTGHSLMHCVGSWWVKPSLTQDPRSLWQHCSEGLIFLPIRIDGKRGHLAFAEAVGYMGRKSVKTAFIEWTSPYLIYKSVSQSGLQPYYPRLNFWQIFFQWFSRIRSDWYLEGKLPTKTEVWKW